MIAQSLQFRRDRMFEFRARNPSTFEFRAVVILSLMVSVVTYVAMAVGWVASIVQLEHGRGSSMSNIWIIVGLIAAVVALTRGGVHALLVSYMERADEARRDLVARHNQETNPQTEETQDGGALLANENQRAVKPRLR
jgi:hypothetical protein